MGNACRALVVGGAILLPLRPCFPGDPSGEGFEALVRPFLAEHCLACHGAETRKNGLALHGYREASQVLADAGVWEKVLEKLRAGKMPPRSRPRPPAESLRAVVGWVEGQLGSLDCSGAIDPGRPTLRRLNRAEYANTLRDLLGVDLPQAQDLPADDVGYGFDTIGDVLSLSPVLLEKYLAAAETAVTLALALELPPENRLWLDRFEAQAMEATGLSGTLPGGARALWTEGEIRTQVRFREDGEYLIRVRASAHEAGPEPTRMALRLEGQEPRVFEVKGEASPQAYEVRLKVRAGRRRCAAAFLNDYYKPEDPDPENRDRNLIIHSLEVEGPLGSERRPLPESYYRLLAADGRGGPPTERARRVLAAFAARAWRRPVRQDEVERLAELTEIALRHGEPFEAAVGLGVQGALVSPHFLFRVESDPEGLAPGSVRPLNGYELAVRLSYFLWSSMPDEELLAAARAGLLEDPAVLEEQVRRMLTDPRSRALVENFAGQWLQIRNLRSSTPDPALFPAFDEELRAAMLQETELFFETVMRENRSILEFLDSDWTFLNERLARHYGVAGVVGNEFRRVKLAGTPRGGVLTQASILTITSNPTRTSPVKRGKWVLEQILGTPPPPPPPDAGELSDEKEVVLRGTLRQRMEEHRKRPDCASCHEGMDPLGFGLESFDAIGAWRERDGAFPVDSSGVLPSGKSFRGPVELKAILLEDRALFTRSLAEKMLTFALGRGLLYHDRCAVDQVARVLERDGYRFQTLVAEVVKSVPFRKKKVSPPLALRGGAERKL